jgi:flagellar FliJ protein
VARRFHFRLQTLLRVRELHEREAKRNVAAKQAEIARLELLNEQTVEEIRRQQEVLLETQRQARPDPLELQRGRAWTGHLRREIADRQALRGQMLEQLGELQGRYQEARKQRRIVEKLRERRWSEYARGRERQQQAVADELAQQLHGYDLA